MGVKIFYCVIEKISSRRHCLWLCLLGAHQNNFMTVSLIMYLFVICLQCFYKSINKGGRKFKMSAKLAVTLSISKLAVTHCLFQNWTVVFTFFKMAAKLAVTHSISKLILCFDLPLWGYGNLILNKSIFVCVHIITLIL